MIPADVVPELILLDLDGTLLGLDRRVSARNSAALRAADAVGARVVIATGRPLRLLDSIRGCVPAAIAICCNGALVIDLVTDAVLQAHPLDGAVLHSAVLGARAAGADFWVGVEGLPDMGGIILEPQAAFRTGADVARAPLAELCRKDRIIVKSLVRTSSAEDAALVRTYLADNYRDEFTVTHSDDDLLIEVSGPGVTKGRTVAGLARAWGIAPERSIAFGDGPNDLEMMAWAGHSVAMGNADPEVKRRASEVAGHHDEHAVARVLERWFPPTGTATEEP